MGKYSLKKRSRKNMKRSRKNVKRSRKNKKGGM